MVRDIPISRKRFVFLRLRHRLPPAEYPSRICFIGYLLAHGQSPTDLFDCHLAASRSKTLI